jgi:hypothetical protein
MNARIRTAAKTRRRVTLCLLAGAALAASAVPAAAADGGQTRIVTAGNRDADAPIVANLEKRFPAASEIFVNCPDGNRITLEPSIGEEPPVSKGPGFQCEYRMEIEGEVVNGQDEVGIKRGQPTTYFLAGEGAPARAPDSWQSCVYHHKTFREEITGRIVSLRGTNCGFSSRHRVEEIELLGIANLSRGEFESKKVPSRFGVGNRGGKAESEVGFVVERFDCTSRTRPIGGDRVRVSVVCGTRFGDGIKLRFDEPAPG